LRGHQLFRYRKRGVRKVLCWGQLSIFWFGIQKIRIKLSTVSYISPETKAINHLLGMITLNLKMDRVEGLREKNCLAKLVYR